MGIRCLASELMTDLLRWRNPQGAEENWWNQPHRERREYTPEYFAGIVVTELTLPLIITIAAIETVVYAAFAAISLIFIACCDDNGPFFSAVNSLASSTFTIFWGIADLFNNILRTAPNLITHESFARYYVDLADGWNYDDVRNLEDRLRPRPPQQPDPVQPNHAREVVHGNLQNDGLERLRRRHAELQDAFRANNAPPQQPNPPVNRDPGLDDALRRIQEMEARPQQAQPAVNAGNQANLAQAIPASVQIRVSLASRYRYQLMDFFSSLIPLPAMRAEGNFIIVEVLETHPRYNEALENMQYFVDLEANPVRPDAPSENAKAQPHATDTLCPGAAFLVKDVLTGVNAKTLELVKEWDAAVYQFTLAKALFVYTFGEKGNEEIPDFFQKATRKQIVALRTKLGVESLRKMGYSAEHIRGIYKREEIAENDRIMEQLRNCFNDWDKALSDAADPLDANLPAPADPKVKALFDALTNLASEESQGSKITKPEIWGKAVEFLSQSTQGAK